MSSQLVRARVRWLSAVCLVAVAVAGCANYVALVRAGVTKTYIVEGAGYEQAFDNAVKAATEAGFDVTRPDKEKGTIFLSRGMGYAESTYMDLKLTKEPGGQLTLMLASKSSQAAEEVIDDFLKAYNKYVQTR